MVSKDQVISALLNAMSNGRPDRDEDEDEPKAAKLPKPMQARNLCDIVPLITRPNPFKVGDLVEQEPTKAIGVYNYPAKGMLGIVTQVGLQDPGIARERGPFTREDIAVACLVDGRWVEFSCESWRFIAYDGPVE